MPRVRDLSIDELARTIRQLGERGEAINLDEVRTLIALFTAFTNAHLIAHGFDARNVRAVLTKFRDAGRRSPPWQPASSKVPGRPQDGGDGNRRPRWDFEPEHKFYADERTATLVEIKYYLQTLSMAGAPAIPANTFQDSFVWLAGHRVEPGAYREPILLEPVDLKAFVANPRSVHSGHIYPLDRGGRHEPANAFLMTQRSNQLQGNLTVPELLNLLRVILKRHDEAGDTEPVAFAKAAH